MRLPRWSEAQRLLAVAIVGVAIAHSGIVPRLRKDGQVIASRNEDWRAAIRWLDARHIDEPAPILLASGLIEADELREAHPSLLEDYCLYPLRTAIYPLHVDRGELIPLPYRQPGKLDPDLVRRVESGDGAWLVIRGRKAVASAVLNDVVCSLLETEARSRRPRKRWRIAEQRSFGKVRVVRLTDKS